LAKGEKVSHETQKPRHEMTKSFTQFLRLGKTGLDIENTHFIERLIAADIQSRAALLRHVRERYPDNYFHSCRSGCGPITWPGKSEACRWRADRLRS